MLHPSIAISVRDAVQRSIEHQIPVRVENLCILSEGNVRQFNVEVLPVQSTPPLSPRFLVLFSATSAFLSRIVRESPAQLAGDRDQTADQLKQDLSSTKIYLQSLVEERDLRNQELTSSNEEVQAANEELQSTNEELETTKEELQSSNEELQTVNEELSFRNTVLTDTSNDLINLLTSVNIPVLMLNNELQIRQVTPLTQKLLSVRPGDIGRPIQEIRLNFSVDNLEELLRDVLATLSTREVEVQDREGRWHLLKIRPYRTVDNKIEGVVLVMLDIDQLRRSQFDLNGARDFARSVIEAVQIPILVLEQNLTVRFTNNAFRQLSNLPRAGVEGRRFPDLVSRIWAIEDIEDKLTSTEEFEGEFTSVQRNWPYFLHPHLPPSRR